MTHATELDLGPLTWVKGEIELALARADEALAQAVEAPGDTGRIQFAQTHLHQARGALSIVGLDGLTQFASSLGQLLGAMGRGERPVDAASISLGRRALAATGNYLEELAHGAPDQALRLCPLYAELAAARGLPAATPADLFFPDLTRRPPRRSPSVPALSEEARLRRLRSLRASFERGLLQWLRQPADVSGPRMMHEAVTGIEALQTSPPLRALWWAALALFEGLAQGDLRAQPEVKRLCARLDAQIRQLSDGLPTVPDSLMREVLYWSSQAPARTEQQRAVRSTWSLDCLLPEGGSAVSETPLAPLLKALQALIGSAKQHWDEFCGGQAAALPPFETQVESLAAQAPQLGRPAFDRLFAGLRTFSQWLRKDPLKFNEAIGLEVATALLLGESALERGVPESGFSAQASDTVDRLSALMRGETVQVAEASRTVEAARRSQEKQALVQLAREIRSSLAQVEQTLDDYFRNQEKRGQLASLAAPLKQIEGALTLLGDDGAIALVREVAGTVSVFAEATETPDSSEFESLAQRLSALGFYVEALQHGRASLESFLNPQAATVAEPVPEALEATQLPDLSLLPEPAPEPVVERPAAEEEVPAVEPIEALPADEGFQIEFPAEPAPLPEPAPDTRKLIEASDEEIDAELLAIFIEEAHEVLATIAEELELSRTEPSDAEHLTSIRRGFHTLKGSGRMVGLRELGEAAWGMEQTLNRWLQLEWPPTSALHHLIDDAHQAFSAWVAQLEAGGGQGRDVAALLAEAERLRSSDQPIGEPAPFAEPSASAQPAAAAVEASAPALVETSLDFMELTVGDDGEVQPYGQAEESAAPLLDEISLEEFSEELEGEESSPPISEPTTRESVPAAEATPDEDSFPALDFGAPAELPPELAAIDITSTNLESDWELREEEAPEAESSPETIDELAVDLDLGVLAETEAEPSVEPSEAIESLELLTAEELGELGAGFAPPVFAEAPAEPAAGLPIEAEAAEPVEASGLPVATPDEDLEILLAEDIAGATLPAMREAEEVQAEAEAVFAFAEPFDEALAEPADDGAGISAEPGILPEPAAIEAEEPATPESAVAELEESTALESAAAEEAVEEPAAAAMEESFVPPEPDLVRVGDVEVSRALYDLYLAEARQHLTTLHTELGRMRANPTLVPSEETLRAVHTLAGISGTTRMEPLHGLARALEHALGRLRTESQPPSPEALDLLDRSSDILQSMLAEVSTGRMPLAVPELGEQLETVGRELPEGEEDEPAATASTAETPLQVVSSVPAAAEAGATEVEAAAVHDDLDEQLLPIFLEEGEELLSALHAELRAWRTDSTDGEHAKPVARLLHTLKGSARMAGAMLLGEHVHQIESRLESAQQAGADPMALIEELESGLDLTEQMIAGLATKGQAAPEPSAGSPAAPAFVATVEAAPEAESAGGGTLRVRAETVDRFVNEAGEIGIARTRIEGELRTLRRSLLDLTENVIRLRNQLREVEIQAEVQMQSRIAQAESHHAEFDPLEMDRYTRLQELTRMMAESVGDVTTVQQNLLRNLDAADLALHSQARLSRELQQALMQVRMVPFDSLADRLYRVVRQSAKDLGKRANLDLRGGRIEIDRSVLEHMVAPLEHLLRNAVAHGIESVEARRAAGKDEIGQITLSVSQEGNEIAISLADDGGGLDYARIAERARANGLLGPDEVADERRLTNLIFVPGFSTAGNLSAISGRGVGMDVVKSETAAVGGRIDVHATAGAGTEFRIYLPLTLAVTQALLVRAANRTFAIPSSMIAQVLELKSDALETLRREGGTEWQGEHYGYRYLPHLLGDRGAHPEQQRFNWVLLLRAGAQALALHVDGLRGNHEIVVKNAGPQLVRIVGISGATVLGDGEIVLIVNPVALASRSLAASEVAADAPAPAAASRAVAYQPTIMVVDDSLTVRKITGRLLEREGYRVVTAKDGVDALERLLETLPDVILSDIEMPRMDGFDLLRNIRADARTHGIPVIMITSRLADKHREYAEKIGANHYLGKPYEEEELLALLQGYTSAAAAA